MSTTEEPPREPKPTLADAIAELKRELALRETCYPNWIKTGKIDETVARRQYARMRAGLRYLMRLQEETQAKASAEAH
jgi:hypothetical protein